MGEASTLAAAAWQGCCWCMLLLLVQALQHPIEVAAAPHAAGFAMYHRLKRNAPPRNEHDGTTTGAMVFRRGATLTAARRTTVRDVKQPKAVLLRINEAAMAAVCCCRAGSQVPAASNIAINQTPSQQLYTIDTC